MKFFLIGLISFLTVAGLSFSKDPFLDIENAVGYIVLSENGKEKKLLVIEGKDNTVKIIEINKEPSKVLRQGGRK